MLTRARFAALTLLLTSSAHAAIGLPTITPVPIPAGTPITDGGGATLDNFVSQDLIVNTTKDWTTAAIVVELAAGSIYQDALGGSDGQAPNPAFVDLPGFESLRFDTFVTNPDGSELGGGASISGAAGDLGHFNLTNTLCPVCPAFGSTTVGITWISPGVDQDDIGNNMIGRFTLSDDAVGFWSLAVTEAGNPSASRFLMNPIVNGQLISDPMPGDLNFDGFTGIEDLNTVLGAWNQSVAPGDRTAGDPSGDGFVGIEDLNTALGNWNAGLVPLVPGSHQPGVIERDYNGDGFVGIEDENIVLTYWNQIVEPGDQTKGDSDGDGFIGISDMAFRNWNAGTPPMPAGGVTPPIAVPEPATALFFNVFCGLVLYRRGPSRLQ